MENRKNIRGASDTGKGRYSTKYLLSGLVICGDFGKKFTRYWRRLASIEYVATCVCMNHQKDSTKYSMLSVKEDNNRNISWNRKTRKCNQVLRKWWHKSRWQLIW